MFKIAQMLFMSFWEHSVVNNILLKVKLSNTHAFICDLRHIVELLPPSAYVYILSFTKSLKRLLWASVSHPRTCPIYKNKNNTSWIISQSSEKWANFKRKTDCETIFRNFSENQLSEKYQNNYMWIFCEVVKVCGRFHKES